MTKMERVEQKIETVEEWARNGLTQQQIANNLGIGLTTLKDYMKKSPLINDAIRYGKEKAVAQVENALFKKALEGNMSAIIFYLKNRCPERWMDKKEPAEIELMKRELKLKERKLELEIDKLKKIIDDEITINITVADEENNLRRAAL